ncbi:hypothetical protein HanIR_Chr08g0380711 [Helianthus annuus]|nr:hypothetical protein HanIR_Chr08g0380711 [Helianthus annuus]
MFWRMTGLSTTSPEEINDDEERLLEVSSPRMQRHSALWLTLLWRKLKKKIKCLQVLIRLILWFSFTQICR